MMDPNAAPHGAGQSPMHAMVRERFSALSPQDQQTLDSVSPEQAAVIVKILPELRDVLMEMMEPDAGMQEAPEPERGFEPEPAPAGGAPFPPQRPKTMLGQV